MQDERRRKTQLMRQSVDEKTVLRYN